MPLLTINADMALLAEALREVAKELRLLRESYAVPPVLDDGPPPDGGLFYVGNDTSAEIRAEKIREEMKPLTPAQRSKVVDELIKKGLW